MKERTAQIYNCDHCNKLYLLKHACEKHEFLCRKNPINYQPCLDGCVNCKKKKFTVYVDSPYLDGERAVYLFYCKKKKVAICPYWYDEPYDLDDTENIHMPKECDYHSDDDGMPF